MAEQKLKIELRPIDEIPHDMLKTFATDSGIQGTPLVEDVIKSEVKIGAFHDEALIGFASLKLECPRRGEGLFLLTGIYVGWRFRNVGDRRDYLNYVRKGIGSKLLYRIMGEAKKREAKGIYMRLSGGGVKLVKSIQERWAPKERESPFAKIHGDKATREGEIIFKRPKGNKRNSPKKRRFK